jgi:hypothetical protein
VLRIVGSAEEEFVEVQGAAVGEVCATERAEAARWPPFRRKRTASDGAEAKDNGDNAKSHDSSFLEKKFEKLVAMLRPGKILPRALGVVNGGKGLAA